jgi:hypothetical protein
MITAENMDTFGEDLMNTALVSFMYTAVKVRTKTVESPKEYQIPIHIVFDILKSFPDGSTSTTDHLQLMEDRCTLFKLAEVSEGEAKKKLLYLSLDDEPRAWIHPINEETDLDWEYMIKAFYLKYYPPIEVYCDQGLIYNFWPHLGESIAQAWGTLKKYLRKNPCHGILMACKYSSLGTPRGRYDEHSSKSSLSCETKVYRTIRRKPNFRR